MPTTATSVRADELGTLLRAESQAMSDWTADWSARRVATHVAMIALGAGCYGAAMGWWRDPWQGVFVAIKFPLILLLTASANALLNAMLAPLLGLNISFRQSFLAVLMSFAIAAAIMGAFAPVVGFLVWNAPPMTPDVKTTTTYGLIKLAHVAVIAFAGLVGNLRLFQLLCSFAKGHRRLAQRVLFAWLAGNLFLGSQLTWIARPFIGSPQLPVVFLRDGALRGNFYENVFDTIAHLIRFIFSLT